MPQVLKENLKEKILNSAREEFLDKGYRNSSMRSIAVKSRTTVGNLYRYFTNKEELLSSIVSPAYGEINVLIRKLTDDRVNMETRDSEISYTREELKNMIYELSFGLAEIYERHQAEFNILMMDSSLNKKITDWFANLLLQLIKTSFSTLNVGEEELQVLAGSYAVSVFSGIKEMLRINKADSQKLGRMVNIYLQSFLNMLSMDIGGLDL